MGDMIESMYCLSSWLLWYLLILPSQLCLLPVMGSVALDDSGAYNKLFQDCAASLPKGMSVLLMVTQQCMPDDFYPLSGFQNCFSPKFLKSHQPALAICSFQALTGVSKTRLEDQAEHTAL